MQSVTLVYKLDGAGWASATIVTPQKGVAFSPSYLSDALGDLVRAVVGIAKARRSQPPFVFEQRVEWFGEPVGLDLIFETQQEGEVRLQLVEMPDESHRRTGRQVLFDDQIDFDIFARSVHGQTSQIFEALGANGYKEKWTLHEFPEDDMRMLGRLLDGRTAA
jgi:hypothetical protein